jgi:hypothetical protein
VIKLFKENKGDGEGPVERNLGDVPDHAAESAHRDRLVEHEPDVVRQLKEGKEFLRAEDAKDEVIKLFKENKGDGEEEEIETDKLPF